MKKPLLLLRLILLVAAGDASVFVYGAGEIQPWRLEARYQRIAAVLDEVWSIDHHTHLLNRSAFNPRLDTQMPLLLRSYNPEYAAVLKERLGLDWDPARPMESDAEGRRRRAEQVTAAGGESAYWLRYLDSSRTEIALINQESRGAIDGQRMRWVPYGGTLLVPFAPDLLGARNPSSTSAYRAAHARLLVLRQADGSGDPAASLADYVAFLERQLGRWKAEGAVALKFTDAYHRTLRFEEVPEARAAALWEQGRQATLSRPDYLALQDYLAWKIFALAGKADLAVHIHSSTGSGPFLRMSESDVTHLDNVLADPRFFGTNFVLIHGGAPWHEAAAYLASNKTHVWIDVSAMPFLYPVPELAKVLRIYLTFAPERTLFSTDTMGYIGTPVGTEFVHLALTRHLREALYLCLADLVRDGVVTEEQSLALGRRLLRENARALYKF
jgi:predicted TIM-barrel fold metal-dependent hydrolase